MKDEKKKIFVTHVNIRLSISLLLIKLIAGELMAATIMIMCLVALYVFVKTVHALNLTMAYGIPIFFILVCFKTFITLFVIMQWLNEYYEISADTIKYRRGIIFRKVDDYPTADIKFVDVEQGLLGRLFNFGTITLLNVRRVQYAQMYLIHNPFRYAQVIEDVIPGLVERKRVIREHFYEEGNGISKHSIYP